MPTFRELQVPDAVQAERLDAYLSQREPSFSLSRSQIKKLILTRQIQVNSRPVKPNHKLNPNDKIQIVIPDPQPIIPLPENIPLDIVYEDEALIVVNKYPGMVVHPGAGNPSGTLVNALLAHCGKLAGCGAPYRPGIVHRLDKYTSGLMVAAKTDKAYPALVSIISRREHHRIYWGLACGEIAPNDGIISAAIGRHPVDRKIFSAISKKKYITKSYQLESYQPKSYQLKSYKLKSPQFRGKEASTNFRVLERYPGLTLVELKPYTGRTHQLRVHLKYIGHPLFGDKTYGGKTSLKLYKAGRTLELNLSRQALHAKILGFVHPLTGKYLEFEAALPPDMQDILDQLREFTAITI